MRKLSVTHVIECDVETFWKTFFDAEYNKKLYSDGLGFKEFEILEQSETKRRMRGVPKMNLPGPVAKLLGDRFGYEEQGSFDKASNKFSWKMLPNTMGDKLFTNGFTKIEPAGDGKVRRISEANIEAKVFGVGGLLESTAEKEVRDSWDKEAAFMNRWVKEHK
ncbi:MAG: DUF2505 domain-containing protein [Polyangiaceae bacterium]|nr:DUF2505 domain-containing protein [Polyangiaceae bacterium]